jgi:RNA polymerase sigma-70 factor (ECF subfamily)
VRMNDTGDLFWKLLEPEYHGAMMFCRKLTGDRDRGDDLYQDALVLACTKFSTLRDTSAFRPWLYRILVNTFKSTVRRPWWKRRVSLSSDIELQLIGDDPIEAHTARRWLQRAFQAISAEEQALVTLYELEGWSAGDLAGIYGLSEGAIKVRVHRARRKMRDALIAMSQRTESDRQNHLSSKGEPCTAAKPSVD